MSAEPPAGDGIEHAQTVRRWPGLFPTIAHWLRGDAGDLPDEGPLPPFHGATSWLGSEALTVQDLRGRVVLVDFWTYTCVNWIRTLPYLREWNGKYASAGLVTVGVHTPEFEFEHDIDNVTKAVRKLDVRYPVAVDSDYRIWNAFANRFWPAVYIADANGRIRYHHFGEGEYAQTEMVLHRLLMDAGADNLSQSLVDAKPHGLEVPADWHMQRSPETYLGYGRGSGFARSGIAVDDEPHDYSGRTALNLNTWDLDGTWAVRRDAVVSHGADASIAFEFHSRDVNLVMGAPAPIPFTVTLDGQRPGDAHGADVDTYGHGILGDHATYQLIRQQDLIATHRFEITFLDVGAEAYCFTFG